MTSSSSEPAQVTTLSFGSEAFDELVRRTEQQVGKDGIGIVLGPASAKQHQRAVSAFAERTVLNIHQFKAPSLIRERFEQTQGNIREAFDNAGERAALLYFDRVDALFELFDTRARAEGEEVVMVDYLMHRVQNFRGACVLSVNEEAHLQELIRKGIDVVVRFDG